MDLDLEHLVKINYDRLLIDLKEGLRYGNFKNCLFWPLVVSGVCAAWGTAFERDFISEQLGTAVADTGTALPVFAKQVLRGFWNRVAAEGTGKGDNRRGKGRGGLGWDDCFDQPYLFVI